MESAALETGHGPMEANWIRINLSIPIMYPTCVLRYQNLEGHGPAKTSDRIVIRHPWRGLSAL
jgi:hypothetical protein